MKKTLYLLSTSAILFSCEADVETTYSRAKQPVIENDGKTIVFPDSNNVTFFITERVTKKQIQGDLTALGQVEAIVLPSKTGALANLVLFNNPELSSHYTQLLQHQVHIRHIRNVDIKQKKAKLDRIHALLAQGLATGRDLLNAESELQTAQTNLAADQAALVEHETQLKTAGFSPERLARSGTAYLFCEIPANQITQISEGQPCRITFPDFPDKKYIGKVDAVADRVSSSSQMTKVRISFANSRDAVKVGMFADVIFNLEESDALAVRESAFITARGKDYVFIKTSANTFACQEVKLGRQIGQWVTVSDGLHEADEIVVEGAMQLKGLSFGY